MENSAFDNGKIKAPFLCNGPSPTQDTLARLVAALERSASAQEKLAQDFGRLLHHIEGHQAADDIVGTAYVANHLGVTQVWAAEMARAGAIPKSCIVAGTGNGKLWKFHRPKIDDWLADGRPGSKGTA
jgi:hypothetical protein